MSLFGVQVNAQLNQLILQIRLKLANNKLSANFRTIYRSFAHRDPNLTGTVPNHQFEKALNENGLFFKKSDIQVFQKAYAYDKGTLSWFAFLGHLKEPMGPIRREVVQEVFNNLSLGANDITIQKLQKHYVSHTYDIFKQVTKNQTTPFEKFASQLHIVDGKVTREEFIAYYDDLNINFPADESFIRSLSNQWNYQVTPKEPVTQEEIKAAIKALRFKLIQKSNGTKDQFLLRKLFDQFDRNKNSSIGAYELDLMLKKLELPTASRLINPLLQHLDKNKSGYIEFDEFKKLVFFDRFAR